MVLAWAAGFATAAITMVMAAASGQPGVASGSTTHAQATGRWVLARADRAPIGIITQAAACPGRLYLLAISRNTIYQFDEKSATLGIALGPEALEGVARMPGELVNLFADCRTNQLSVVVNPLKKDASSLVATFDLGNPKLVRVFELPNEFSPSLTGSPTYDAASRRVFIAGIWPSTRNGWLTKPVSQALTDARFGLILSVDDGRTSKFLPGSEEGCRSWAARCLDSMFVQSQPDEWVFAHGFGTQLSVIRAGQIIRSLDMRTPKFRYLAGDSVPRNAPREQGMAWSYRNSEIRRLFVVNGQIVATHAHHSTEKPNTAGWVDFTAYLNVFDLKGDRVHSDLRLSDLPIGASFDAVWVASYRPERNDQATEIVIERVSPGPAAR